MEILNFIIKDKQHYLFWIFNPKNLYLFYYGTEDIFYIKSRVTSILLILLSTAVSNSRNNKCLG